MYILAAGTIPKILLIFFASWRRCYIFDYGVAMLMPCWITVVTFDGIEVVVSELQFFRGKLRTAFWQICCFINTV